jgi:hypothetical protein
MPSPSFALTYRTAGAWGSGKGSNLTPYEVDLNFWSLDQRAAALEESDGRGVGIEAFHEHGNQLFVTLTNSVVLGPFDLPIQNWTAKGAWTPDTFYNQFDVVSFNGQLYLVMLGHTSPPVFDAGFNLGSGQDCYQLVLEDLANELPTGGAELTVLTKRTSADYDVAWLGVEIDNCSDFVLSSPRSTNDVLTWAGSYWTNSPIVFASTIDGQQDFSLTDPRNIGDVLTWNGIEWINAPIALNLEQLGDVLLASGGAVNGDTLVWNGATWSNGQPSLSLTDIGGFQETAPVDGQVWVYNATSGQYENKNLTFSLNIQVTETDLLAGNIQYLVCPKNLVVTRLRVVVQKTVTTGGVIKLQKSGVDVTGATVTVANGAAAGTVYGGVATGANSFSEGQVINTILDPAFAGAGAVNITIEYQ